MDQDYAIICKDIWIIVIAKYINIDLSPKAEARVLAISTIITLVIALLV